MRLVRQKVTPGTQIALVDDQGHLIGHEDLSRLVTVAADADAAAISATHVVAVPLLNRRHQLVGALLLRRSAIEDVQLSFVQALSGVDQGAEGTVRGLHPAHCRHHTRTAAGMAAAQCTARGDRIRCDTRLPLLNPGLRSVPNRSPQ
ncbi:MAG: hypothetical protein KIT18_03915 [Burkholderiales bacterium]|nr:hypothetical protein [Burkholderiales bacterium]